MPYRAARPTRPLATAIALALLLATASLLALLLPTAAFAGTYITPLELVTGPGNQGEPALDYTSLAYVDDSAGNADIYGLTVGGAPVAICTNTANQHHPAVSGNYVVWWDARYGTADIMGYRLSTSTEFPIAVAVGEQVWPAISSRFVVWQDNRSGGWDIWAYDLADGASFPVCTAAGTQQHPSVAGTALVWEDKRNGNWDVYGARIDPDTHAVTEFPVKTALTKQTLPAFDGTTVAWQTYRRGGWDLYGATIDWGPATPVATPLSEPVCTAGGDQTHVQVQGYVFVWQDTRDVVAGKGIDIWARNTLTDTEFPICVRRGDQVLPAFSYPYVAWDEMGADDGDIRGGKIEPWDIFVQVNTGTGWTRTNDVDLYMEVMSDDGPPTQMAIWREGLVGVWQPFDSPSAITLPAPDGAKVVYFHFRNAIGDMSPIVQRTVRLDTVKPVTKAPYPETVTRGRVATLKYRVNDPSCPRATVTIRIKTLGGALRKTLKLGQHSTGEPHSKSFTCNLPRGTYRFWVYAKDLANNAQASPVGHNKLAVR